VYLLNRVRHAESSRRTGNRDVESQTHLDATVYFDSFADIADRLWNLILGPFRKYDDNMDEFVLGDDDEDDDEGDDDRHDQHRALDMEQALGDDSVDEDEQLVKYYEQRAKEARRNGDHNESSLNSEVIVGNHDDLEDTDEDEIKGRGNAKSENEESSDGPFGESSEDEWDQKQTKRRGSIGRKVIAPKRRNRQLESPGSSAKKRRAIRESDDDGSD
jgi:hypothetical protein